MIGWRQVGQITTLLLLVGFVTLYASGCNHCNTNRKSPGVATEVEVHVEWPDAGSLLSRP